MKKLQLLSLGFAALFAIVSAAHAQADAALVSQIRAQIGSFSASSVEAAGQARRAQLCTAVAALDAHLKTVGDVEAGWRAYLDFHVLQKACSGTASLAELGKATHRFYRVFEGLDVPAVRAVRAPLDRYTEFARALSQRPSAQSFDDRLGALVQNLSSSNVDYHELNDTYLWLKVLGQAPALTQALEDQFSAPNARIVFGDAETAKLLANYKTRGSQEQFTRNTIAGTLVTGVSQVEQELSPQLVETAEGLRLEVQVKGTYLAPHSTGWKKRFQVYTRTEGTFSGVQQFFWDKDHMVATQPQFSVDFHSRIKGVNGALLPGLVLKGAEKKRPQGEKEAEALFQKALVEQATKKADELVQKGNQGVSSWVHVFQSVGMFPEVQKLSLEGKGVSIGVGFPARESLLAPQGSVPKGAFGAVTVDLHESAIGATLRRYLGGQTWTDVEFATFQRDIFGWNSPEFFIGLTPERWRATWDWKHPIETRFSKGIVSVDFGLSGFEVDGVKVEHPVYFRGNFKLLPGRSGVTWQRQGDLQHLSDQKFWKEDEFRAFAVIARKMNELLGESLHLDGIQFPAGSAWDMFSQIHPLNIDIGEDWGRFGFIVPEFEKTTAKGGG